MIRLKESKAKYYSGYASYCAVYDHYSGRKNRYTLYLQTSGDPLVIGRELELQWCREVIKSFEDYFASDELNYRIYYNGRREDAIIAFNTVTGQEYKSF